MMQIEVGKYYRTRDGRKVGPIRQYEDDTEFFDIHDIAGTTESGWIWDETGIELGKNRDIDLIAEWTDEPAQPTLSGITIDHIAIDSLRHHYATEMEQLQKEAFRIVLRYYGVTV